MEMRGHDVFSSIWVESRTLQKKYRKHEDSIFRTGWNLAKTPAKIEKKWRRRWNNLAFMSLMPWSCNPRMPLGGISRLWVGWGISWNTVRCSTATTTTTTTFATNQKKAWEGSAFFLGGDTPSVPPKRFYFEIHPMKVYIDTHNGLVWKKIPFKTIIFFVLMLNFRGAIIQCFFQILPGKQTYLFPMRFWRWFACS